MKTFFSKFKWGTLFPAILLIAVGVVLVIPELSSRATGIVAGVLLAVGGLLCLISFFCNLTKNPALLLAGIVQLAIALWIFISQSSMLRVLTIALGVMLLLRAAAAVIDGVSKRKKGWFWIFEIAMAAIFTALAIVILAQPFSALSTLVTFTGAVVIAEGAFEIFVLACRGFFRDEEEEEKPAGHRPAPPPRKPEEK